MVDHETVTAAKIVEKLRAAARPDDAVELERFFRTGPGEYGEGDRFLGVKIPEQRKIARLYFRFCPFDQLEVLLGRDLHECRMTALLMLVYAAESPEGRRNPEPYARFYLDHIDRVNNWDLVDVTAPKILGPWLYPLMFGRRRPESPAEAEAAAEEASLLNGSGGDSPADHPLTGWDVLSDLVRSGKLWRQRAAMLTTLYFIREGEFSAVFELADMLLDHRHDLIHKAVGWMLREVGNRNPQAERDFLDSRYREMPRTMLRYAIEKFPEPERQAYLRGEI